MSPDLLASATDWRRQAPRLASKGLTLREPVQADATALVSVLNTKEGQPFGLDIPVDEESTRIAIEQWTVDRQSGRALTLAIVTERRVVGLFQIRQLDPKFEGAECEMTLLSSERGTGIFSDAAQLALSFIFASVGTHRVEARVLLQNGRAMGAMRKLGAVQEGVLRRSLRRGEQYLDQVLWSILNEDWWNQRGITPPRVH